MELSGFLEQLESAAREGFLRCLGGEVPAGRLIEPPAGARVLALAPHPDDPDAVAVTLRRLALAGCRITYAVACLSPQGVTDSYALAEAIRRGMEPPADLTAFKRELRQGEQLASAGLAGFLEREPEFLSLKEDRRGRILHQAANSAAIGAVLRGHDPDLVLLPHGEDTNLDHVGIWNFLREQAPGLAARRGRPLLALFNRDPKTVRITEHLATPFTAGEAQWKAELLAAHRSQQARNLESRGYGFDQRILRENRAAWEQLSGRLGESWTGFFPYAESFQVELFR